MMLPIVDLDPAPRFPRIELPGLLRIAENPDLVDWEPFKEGVDIHRLYGDRINGPSAALLRYRVGGKVPLHEHIGYEHILVLAGTQRDNNGTASAGTLIVNPPGSCHSVMSDAGCIVLAIYERAVRFVDEVE
jgi:anti-sigma factor ChrR (cupin superfamily)